MKYADLILPEFEHEMANTRKVLEQVPDDKLDWKVHEKSNTIGWNASHLVEIPGWVEGTLTQDSWEIAGYQTAKLGTRDAILALFDENVATAKKAFSEVADEAMDVDWTLTMNGEVISRMPRSAVIRSFVINHTIHHRAHLCVYLRLNDIPVPGMYGPSGDEI